MPVAGRLAQTLGAFIGAFILIMALGTLRNKSGNMKNLNDSNDLGGFTVGQWKVKRENLKSNLGYSAEWEEAFNWYKRRLDLRYFAPMRNTQSQITGAGFTLVTIQCVLIEHLASITKGKIFNRKVNRKSPKYEYSSSSQHFQEFLKTSNLFSSYFNNQSAAKPEFDSKDFYENVRCSLLHEACTKNDWRINTLSCGYPNPDKKIFVKEMGGIKRIFRDVLNQKLTDFLDQYKKEFQTKRESRLYFARKLDHLCEIKPDPNNYEWWEDK